MYDPIQRAIDIQLSWEGHPHNPEILINNAFDLKYHFSEYREEKILYLALSGFIQREISDLTGFSQGTISKKLKKITNGRNNF